jgi:zinc transporter ZupT
VTALVIVLGAIPFLFARNVHAWWLSITNGAAAGLMLGASHNLIVEGSKRSTGLMLVGILIGLAAVVLANRLIKRRQVPEANRGKACSMKRIALIWGCHTFRQHVPRPVADHHRPPTGHLRPSRIPY